MRTIVAVGLAVVILFAGVTAVSQQAQDTEEEAVTNGTNASEDAWNFGKDTYGGLTEAAGPAVVVMGVSAFVLVAGGLLLSAGRQGR